MKKYLVIDHMVLVHVLAAKLDSESDLEAIKKIITVWVGFISRPWLYISDCPYFEASELIPILVADAKTELPDTTIPGYWRHQEFPQYKGNRKHASGLLNRVRALTLSVWNRNRLPLFFEGGFEADDFASCFVNNFKDNFFALLTVDSDWSGLVGENCIWLDTYCGKHPRKNPLHQANMLDSDRVLTRFNSHKDFANYPLDKPSDIYIAKHFLGDKSDNIPAGNVVDFGIIDLLNPNRKIDHTKIMLPESQTSTDIVVRSFVRPDMFGLPVFEWSK